METSEGPVSPHVKHRTRVYEQWEGNEKIFCWGYLVAGPNWKASFGTALLILAPAVIFWVFVAPYLTSELSPAIMVFAILLPVLSFMFLFMTACSDPGIIPRQEPDEEYLAGRKPRTKEVMVNDKRVVIRYNDTCHYYQPPRAHHCSVNDNCIERFDHHCPWVGTTIGKRNYRTFLLFVNTTAVTCLYVFGCCLAMIFVKHRELQGEAEEGENTWGETIGDCIPAIALMAYTFLFFFFVGGLSMFHCYLVGTNQTTYENFRYNDGVNPYHIGLLGNCAEVWCTRVPKSKVNFRAYVDEVQAEQRREMAAAQQQEQMQREEANQQHDARHQELECSTSAQMREQEGEERFSEDSFDGPHDETLHSVYMRTQQPTQGEDMQSAGSGTAPVTPHDVQPELHAGDGGLVGEATPGSHSVFMLLQDQASPSR